MFLNFLKPEILELVKNKNWKELKNILSKWPSPDIADFLENLEQQDSVILFRLLSRDLASDVFAELQPTSQENLVKSIENAEIKKLMIDLSPDDRTEFFDELPTEFTQKILSLLPPNERKEALYLLGYQENSVGRLMTPDYISVHPDWSVDDCIKHVRNIGKDAETINMIYVTDEKGKLLDDIPLRKFILTETRKSVSDLMDNEYIAILDTEDQEQAYQFMKHYNLNVLPIIDSFDNLLGIVTIDDIIDVLEEEITEDFHKAAAVHPMQENYLLASPFLLYKKRVVWLLLLLVANFLSSSIIAHFEYALHTFLALAFFIPVLIDSGGNTASQSSTIIIRAIATGDLNIKNWFSVIKKELVVGLLLGLSLGIVIYFRSVFWQSGSQIGLVVGLSLILVMLWSNFLGSILPIILTKFKLDPAVISSPLLTTVVDASGLLIYFMIAETVLNLG
jgi:magnesium transporter